MAPDLIEHRAVRPYFQIMSASGAPAILTCRPAAPGTALVPGARRIGTNRV